MAPGTNTPVQSRDFLFAAARYDPATGVAELVYRMDEGPDLVERITFPHAPWPPESSRQAGFEAALQLLHLVAGVSYWKAGLAPRMQTNVPIDTSLAGFVTTLYQEGLAEFAHVNGIDMQGLINLSPGDSAPPVSHELLLPDRALVAIGGGKDSLVGLDLVRQAGVEVLPVCVGSSQLIGDTVAAAGLPLLRIGRSLAPGLKQMNEAGAWNGHVPVTAINSAILLCASILYGFRYIVFSNERSADESTLTNSSGTPVNHQYSKSSGFEALFRGIIASHVSPDIEYFSILRPFSELEIVRRFSGLKAFHHVYSSCNRNFHLDGPRVTSRWCRDCPKCRFAALSLAVFLPPEAVVSIQGADLLDDPSQLPGFRSLCALGVEKPFECVGEAGESRAAFAALARRPEWENHLVVRELAPLLGEVEVPELADLLEPSSRHSIPPLFFKSMGLEPIP